MPLLAGASGIALAVAFPIAFPIARTAELDPHGHLEWLAWVGLVPLLAAIDRARTWWRAGAAGLLAGAIFGLLLTYWLPAGMAVFGFRSRAFCLGLWLLVSGLIVGLHWGLAATLTFVVRKGLGWRYWKHIPFTWAATELSRSYVLRGFAWGNLGYSQARHGSVSQLAAFGGVYLVAAFLVFVAAVLFEAGAAVVRREPIPLGALSGGVAVVAAVLGFGGLRQVALRRELEHAPVMRVAAVQLNLPHQQKGRTPSADILNRLLPLTVEADRRGADLVVWPETAFPGMLPSSLETFTDVPGWPTDSFRQAHVLVGAMTFARSSTDHGQLEIINGALLVTPSHEVVGRYSKQRLVPFAEYRPVPAGRTRALPVTAGSSGARQADPLTLTLKGGGRAKLATLICSDAYVPAIARAQARSDPDLFVVISNEAWSGRTSMPYQAQAMMRVRAVETGKALVRASYSGPSAVLLPTGEVGQGALPVAAVKDGADVESSLLFADVPRQQGETVYTQIGDVFAWAAAFTALALVRAALIRGQTEKKRDSPQLIWKSPLGQCCSRRERRRSLPAALFGNDSTMSILFGILYALSRSRQ